MSITFGNVKITCKKRNLWGARMPNDCLVSCSILAAWRSDLSRFGRFLSSICVARVYGFFTESQENELLTASGANDTMAVARSG